MLKLFFFFKFHSAFCLSLWEHKTKETHIIWNYPYSYKRFLFFSQGFTGGSWYAHPGAAVDPLCLPRDPEWGIYKDGVDGQKAFVYGSEYQTFTSNSMPGVFEHDVPCAVCVVRNRSLLKMFPGKTFFFTKKKFKYEVILNSNCIKQVNKILDMLIMNRSSDYWMMTEVQCYLWQVVRRPLTSPPQRLMGQS